MVSHVWKDDLCEQLRSIDILHRLHSVVNRLLTDIFTLDHVLAIAMVSTVQILNIQRLAHLGMLSERRGVVDSILVFCGNQRSESVLHL